jgi:hypothetical protein
MPGFTYWTKSADGKLKGSVTVDYIRGKLMHKLIEGVGTANDGTFIELYFSDGAQIAFTLNGDFGHPEVHFLEATRK